jgi:hypothetical protein
MYLNCIKIKIITAREFGHRIEQPGLFYCAIILRSRN